MPRVWHHLPLSAIAVLWNLILVGDYLGLKLNVVLYTDGFTPEQVAWFADMPPWLNVAWGAAVWCGMLGAILLTSRMATGIFFAISFIGWAVMTVGLIWVRTPPIMDVSGQAGLYLLIASTGLAFLYFLYTRAMHVRWRKLRAAM